MMDRTGTPDKLWFLCLEYLIELHNHWAAESLKWKTPIEIALKHLIYQVLSNLNGLTTYITMNLQQNIQTAKNKLVVLLELHPIQEML